MNVPDPSPPVEVRGLTLPALHQKLMREGACHFRELKIGIAFESDFRKAWAKQKRDWLARGFSLRLLNSSWILQQWLLVTPSGYVLTQVGREKLAEIDSPRQAEMRLISAPPVRQIVLPDLPSAIEAKLRGYQIEPTKQIYRALMRGREEWGYPGACDLSDMGTGKAQPLSSLVVTPQGMRPIGSLKPGDAVFSIDGKPCGILGVYPQGERHVFRVTFSDGSFTRCCAEHLWAVQNPNDRARGNPPRILQLSDLQNDLACSGGSKWSIPLTSPVEFAPKPLEIDPYLLGLLLGDGCFVAGTPRISTNDSEVVKSIAAVLPANVSIRHLKGCDYTLSFQKFKPNPLTKSLRELGLMGRLSNAKFIPSPYLLASISDRVSLLQGLMDSDGTPSGASSEFCTVSDSLAAGVKFLAQSLGGTAVSVRHQTGCTHKGTYRKGQLSWRIRVSLPDCIAPFRLARKMSKMEVRTKYPVKRAIRSITPDGIERCVCIAVDHPSRLYLTDDFIVTHNTYMDLGAAIATGRDPAILCPTVGAAGWQRACDHFGITPHFISTYEAVRGGFRNHIATLDATGKFTWKNPNEIVLILDEAQALRHDDTLTVRCCSAAIRQGVPIIVASATIAISPVEFRFAGRVTGLHGGGDDWDRWLMQHGCFKKGQSYAWDGKPHHLQRINSQLFPWRGARVRKQDLGEECPETIISTLPMDIPEAARIEQEWKDTEEMLNRLAKQVGGVQLKIMEQRAHMKMWQRCELAIVPHLAERIKKDVKDGKSVAVFTNFDKSRIELSKLLNTNAGFFGGQPLAKRQYWEREFQADRQHILINNIGAGGASVSLHDVNGWRSRVAYILPTDHVIKMEQATGRVDRVGGKSTSEQYIPYVAGSMTEKMIARTRRKMARIAIINDGANAVASRF